MRPSYAVHSLPVEAFLDAQPDGSADLIVCDGPYCRVKGDAWDRAWKTADAFLAWMGGILERFRRVLAPNGSLYVFASPEMGAQVEVEVRRWFTALNNIRWAKAKGRHLAACKEDLRSYFPASETVIFAEQRGSDSVAMGEAGRAAKCDEVRGFVFEPLRAYLDGERRRAGLERGDIDGAWQAWKGGKGGMSSHWFSASQWALPAAKNYEWLRALFNARGGDLLARPWEDLRREYETLRAQYESLRRPFTVSAQVPYTDVWDFPTVPHYRGKHSCEKPPELIRHIIEASSRPGGRILDPFCGSGVTGEQGILAGRVVTLNDGDATWAERARERCERAAASMGNVLPMARPVPVRAPRAEPKRAHGPGQLGLFGRTA